MTHKMAPTCGSARCRWCLDRERNKARPLTPDDMRWYFGQAASDLGARSTLGAFVDMALSGPPTGGGGKSNGVENQAVEARRLRAAGRERCIRARLAGVPAEVMAVLRIAYDPTDWTACHSPVKLERGEDPNPLTAPEVHAAARRAFGPEALRLAPMTPIALDRKRRKQAATAPPSKPRPDRARKSATTDAQNPRAALAGLFSRDPLLARTARGAVLMAACGVGDVPAELYAKQAGEMLAEAHRAAGITEPEVRRPSVRRSYTVEVADDA